MPDTDWHFQQPSTAKEQYTKTEISDYQNLLIAWDFCFCRDIFFVVCLTCECYKGCIDRDDTNPTIDKLTEAGMILFATPVYWWGITAQMKLVIDKCYCRGMQLKEKKVGAIVIGGAPTDGIQYELIRKQFECMGEFLAWDMVFHKSYSAGAGDELAKNEAAIKELEQLGASV